MQDVPYFKIPMPDDVREWLDKAAKKASRSRGSHVLALIRQEMEREEMRAIYDANYIPSHVLQKGK